MENALPLTLLLTSNNSQRFFIVTTFSREVTRLSGNLQDVDSRNWLGWCVFEARRNCVFKMVDVSLRHTSLT